jgi:hypothetical protein
MTTAKKIAASSAPATSPTPKPSVKKTTHRAVANKKAAAKKPLSKALVPVNSAKTATAVNLAKPARAEKPKKPKLVRDSFTIPKVEYVVLEELKERAARLMRAVKKSELLRAGIKALASLPDAAFMRALENVPAIKTGRPASAK